MTKPNKKNRREPDGEERLRMENEIEKLKLSAFYGAKFSSKSELPPEIENEWLRYITQFEEQYENAAQITVAERLGNPEFPPVKGLSEKEIGENLEKVQDLMAEHHLFLDAVAEVSSAELYRFIIEELFDHKIDDINIEGMSTNFIYEEFHPNDELDIEQTLTDFIRQMLSSDFHDYLDMHLAGVCKTSSGETITKEKAVERAYTFGDLYDNFTIDRLGDFQIHIIDDTNPESSVQFYISYQAIPSCKASGKQTVTRQDAVRFEGQATALLHKGELEYWNIVSLNMPGFSF